MRRIETEVCFIVVAHTGYLATSPFQQKVPRGAVGRAFWRTNSTLTMGCHLGMHPALSLIFCCDIFFFGVSTKPFRVFPIHLIELCLFCRIVVHTVHTAHHPHTHHLTTVSPHYFETFHNPTFPPTEYHISIHNTLSVFAIFSIIFCDFYYLFFPRYCLGVPWLGPAGGAHGAAARPGGPPHHRHPRHGPRCAPPPGVPLSRDAEPGDRLHRPEGPASLRAEPLRGQGPASIVKMA